MSSYTKSVPKYFICNFSLLKMLYSGNVVFDKNTIAKYGNFGTLCIFGTIITKNQRDKNG
jgi:hypothetical protein